MEPALGDSRLKVWGELRTCTLHIAEFEPWTHLNQTHEGVSRSLLFQLGSGGPTFRHYYHPYSNRRPNHQEITRNVHSGDRQPL